MYNSIIRLYALGARCLSLRNPKVKKMTDGHKETFNRLRSALNEGDRPVWIHAASLGEFEQARPLIERLRRERPELKIVLSFFSPSGYEVRKNYNMVDAVVYLPFDTPANATKFIDTVNPSVAIFVKYEFWGNYLTQLSRRKIPTYIISAIFRPSQIFFRPYGGMMRNVLRCFNRLYVQDDNSRKLLSGIGIDNVTVAGDTRFDRVTDVMRHPATIPSINLFNLEGGGADIVFGSSWPTDEEKYIPWLNDNPEIHFIIAPHEFDERRVKQLRDSITGNVMLLSEWGKTFATPTDGSDGLANPAGIRGLIVDSFGLLSTLYGHSKMAYIGGGFGAGLHNINEAAVYGIPVIYGPNNAKFKEAQDLARLGGGFPCNNAEEVVATLNRLYDNPEAREQAGRTAGDYIKSNIGATDKIFNDIFG
ncbi:MAG: 3-deoxy-D-manno-octulosonic acid transferase [Muribaculaceae bacterium]|nr:3-deoxy-D-manno-octulosonic acid transferase [Muribaculaceae bacterium]